MIRETEVSDPVDDDLISDQAQIATIEAQNALKQFDFAMEFVDAQIKSGAQFQLEKSLICDLNKIATAGIKRSAGTTRTCPVGIRGSNHAPPPHEEVEALLGEMCKYINDRWHSPAIHLAAYLLWRINWIHGFNDGNGRTARMVSYVVLCVRLGFALPGIRTIPEQISVDRQPYYKALETADEAFKKGTIDLRELEQLLSDLLTNQLSDILDQAIGPTGKSGP